VSRSIGNNLENARSLNRIAIALPLSVMRKEVIELGKLGPLPSSVDALRDNLGSLIFQYEKLIISIKKPVTDEEARLLTGIFGPDDGYGLAWILLRLIESAPGWPLWDTLHGSDNEWIELLRQRLKNAGRIKPSGISSAEL
jgi:hypothetical protein